MVFIGTVDERELSLMIRKLKIYMLFITQPMQAIYIYIYIYIKYDSHNKQVLRCCTALTGLSA